MRNFRWLFAFVIAAALTPAGVAAQQAATVSGQVTSESGTPIANATVSIRQLNVGATTGANGSYSFTVPASRIQAGTLTLTATRLGFASQSAGITLTAGQTVTQNFQLGTDVLQLEGIVATGQGTETTRERLTSAVSTVEGQDIQRSNENNVVQALAGKAPAVNVTSSSGDPGAGSYIRIRDAASIVAGTQPLFIVDGTPIDNSSNQIESGTAGTAVANRASDLNPADIEDVQVLKGPGAAAIYGSRGANGVILITTKSGQAGGTRATLSSSVGFNTVNQLPALQRQFGRGLTAQVFDPDDLSNVSASFPASYGPPLPAGTETFDHAGELFETGTRYDNNLTVSGGNDRTTYFLGVGRADNNGTIPDAQNYSRTSVRLKGSHFFSEDIQVSGNVAYATTGGDYIQQGSNTSGLLLGALRTPPEFNNLPFLTEGGLQRSYRRPNPTSPSQGSGYDNPFFQINQGLNTSEVGRTFGNIQIDYAPVTWLKLNYTLGADYSSDERRTLLPKSSATQPTGKFIRANFVTDIIDSNLTATASGTIRDTEQGSLAGSLTVGQNLAQEDFRQNLIETDNILRNTALTDFSVDRRPNEFRSRVRTDGYFVTGELTYNDQLTFTGTGRYDGSSTFGGDSKRFFYPSVGASWVFSKLPAFDNVSFLDFGKLRASWGRAGRQPPVFSNVTGFVVGDLFDGFVFGQGFNTIYQGQQGVFSQTVLRNPDIKPEVKTEFEIGGDLAFFGQRASLGVTYFDNRTEDVILSVPVPPSTGYNAQLNNAAEFTGDGIEVTLDLIPVQMDNFAWNIGMQYAKTNTCVEDIAGAESVFLAGFTSSAARLVSKDLTGECQSFGVLYGDDFVRFGRGSVLDGVNIDEAFPGTADGTLYIAEDGFPLLEDRERVGGDPNPDWTGSVRNTFTIANNLRISGLVDIKQGGDVWNGTKGALVFFGTSEASLPYHGAGTPVTFGQDYMPNFGVNPNFPGGVAGPGVGTPVVLNWDTWAIGGLGSGFTGPFTQFIEDGSFVKLRDISVSYTLEMPWIERLGFTSIDLTASGRNLKTWTDYTGIDPESNLTGQSTGRGLDYFNNPQTRSYIFTVNLNK
ncbi:SusC/RagA family TonB-linked outer membrane protein [soil metagenome]